MPTWIEIPVEAGVGHVVALLMGLLAAAAVAGQVRRRAHAGDPGGSVNGMHGGSSARC